LNSVELKKRRELEIGIYLIAVRQPGSLA